MKKTMIYVVRHAQSVHNESGALGPPLTEEGTRQASQLANAFNELGVSEEFQTTMMNIDKR